MKREKVEQQKVVGKFQAPADAIFKSRPHLAMAVADCLWDDGTTREPYALSVNWASGTCLVSLNDRAECRSVSTSCDDFDSGLDALEALLKAERLPWRYWGAKKKK